VQRRRTVPAAPKRSASDTWHVIEGLLSDVLRASPHVNGAEVSAALSVAARVGRLLVAGGHLDKHSVVLVAPPVHLTIQTVSGDRALSSEEPGPVPGGASITEWTLHLPAPDPLGDVVREVSTAHAHLSDQAPPDDTSATSSAGLDREALRARLYGGRS
jgi:hypothetical protein